MPELPEVETIRRQLVPRLHGRTIVGAGSHPSAKFTPARETIGRFLIDINRRGKFLLFELDDGDELVAHLGMTGQFRVTADEPPAATSEPMNADDNRHLRAWWALDNGQRLEFVDVRRFGRLAVVRNNDYRQLPTLHKMGPEPFDPTLDAELFWRLLAKSRRAVKPNLLSQRPIAGVGNIYADEALWLAEINPRAVRVGRERAATLLEAIRQVLHVGISNGGTTLRNYRDADGGTGKNQNALNVYGQAGEPCPRCATALKATSLQGRTTTWCSNCQHH